MYGTYLRAYVPLIATMKVCAVVFFFFFFCMTVIMVVCLFVIINILDVVYSLSCFSNRSVRVLRDINVKLVKAPISGIHHYLQGVFFFFNLFTHGRGVRGWGGGAIAPPPQLLAPFHKGMRLMVRWISIVAQWQLVYNLRLIATLSETGPWFIGFFFPLAAQSRTVMTIIPLPHYGNKFGTTHTQQQQKSVRKMCRVPPPPPQWRS